MIQQEGNDDEKIRMWSFSRSMWEKDDGDAEIHSSLIYDKMLQRLSSAEKRDLPRARGQRGRRSDSMRITVKFCSKQQRCHSFYSSLINCKSTEAKALVYRTIREKENFN